MSACARAILLDEDDLARAAADGLDADGARSRVRIDDARAGDARRQDVEQRLAQLVGRRPQTVPVGRFQPPTFQRTGDHAHESGNWMIG